VTDLEHYDDVLRDAERERVFFTREGRGAFVLLSQEEFDEMDRAREFAFLVARLNAVKERCDREGWIAAETVKQRLGW